MSFAPLNRTDKPSDKGKKKNERKQLDKPRPGDGRPRRNGAAAMHRVKCDSNWQPKACENQTGKREANETPRRKEKRRYRYAAADIQRKGRTQNPGKKEHREGLPNEVEVCCPRTNGCIERGVGVPH